MTEKEQLLFILESMGVPVVCQDDGIRIPSVCKFCFDHVTGKFTFVASGPGHSANRDGTTGLRQSTVTTGDVYFTQEELGRLSIIDHHLDNDLWVVQGQNQHKQALMPKEPFVMLNKRRHSIGSSVAMAAVVTGARYYEKLRSLGILTVGVIDAEFCIVPKSVLLCTLNSTGVYNNTAAEALQRERLIITTEVFDEWVRTS